MNLLHIVPRLPPEIDGIGDFATTLGEHLERALGAQSHYLSCENDLPERRGPALAEQVRRSEAGTVLLHYAGYGYDRRGVPEWLADGLETAVGGGARLLVFFHEIWTETAPWRSAFYFAGAQRRLVRRLQQAAAGVLTSTPRMQRRLGRAELAIVPSAIPPIERAAPFGHPPRIMVFGLEHTRERTIRAHGRLLRALGANGELWCVGKGASPAARDARLAAKAMGPGQVKCVADAGPDEVARRFAAASFSLSFYPLDFLTKSSSTMAALACGCPLALPMQTAREEYAPRPPVLLLDGAAETMRRELAPASLARASEASRAWYREHADWPVLVRKLARMLPVAAEAAA